MIQAVNGAIDINDIGNTLSHEHIAIINQEMRFQFPNWFNENKFLNFSIPQLKRLKDLGINTIIDATPINLGRDVRLLKKVSQMTGINIIASTGLYFMEEPWVCNENAEYLSEIFIKEITEGISGTNIKAGVIKCATDKYGISDYNRITLEAAAMASVKTNTPIITHTLSKDDSPKNGLEQQRVLIEAGADPLKIVIGHLGDSNDLEYLVSIIENGSYIGLDRFGVEHFNSMENRIDTLVKLIEMGLANKILLSHDANFYSNVWHSWDKEHYIFNPKRNMLLISEYVLPELKKRGVSDMNINLMMNENIKKLFR